MVNLPKTDSAKIVKQALSFEKPDRLPVFDGFWGGFIENWRNARRQPAGADIEDYYWIDSKGPVANEAFFPSRMGEVGQDGEYKLANDGWGRAVFVKIGGPFIRCSFFRGETEFLIDMAADEGFAAAQVEKVGDHILSIGLESLKRANAYDFGLWIYDDMCNINGPMFSPKTFEKIYLPVYKRIISTIKAAGAKWVILHCDGNLLPFLDMLIDAGIDGINPVEYSAGLDVVKLKERYGSKLRYIGGVCNTHILTSGDKGRIREHVEALADAGRNGGLVIGTHSIGPDISIEDYELYRNTVLEGV